MATYLLIWKPERWCWTNLHRDIAQLKRYGTLRDSWGCGVTKRIQPDDRVFLIKLGRLKPRGIMASGFACSGFYKDTHWDRVARARGKRALYINIDFDTILDPEDGLFPRELLDVGIYARMNWEPRASGTTIPDEVAEQLERDWARFLGRRLPWTPVIHPDEAETERIYVEGASREVTVNAYERNPAARERCIQHYGTDCVVCGFRFERTYGEIGAGFVHVHHLRSLAKIRGEYQLHPVRDLRPVCPNCHAMLHRRKPAYTIEELQAIIKQATRRAS